MILQIILIAYEFFFTLMYYKRKDIMIIILMLLLNTCLLKSAANPETQLSLRTADQLAADQKLALFLRKFSRKSIIELTAANQLRIAAANKGDKEEIEQARRHYIQTVALMPEILAIPGASEGISKELSGEAKIALEAEIAESKDQQKFLHPRLAPRLAHPHALASVYPPGHIPPTYVTIYPRPYPGTYAPAYVAAYPEAPAYNPTYVAEVMHQQGHPFVLPASSLPVPLQTTTFVPGPIFRAVGPALPLAPAYGLTHAALPDYRTITKEQFRSLPEEEQITILPKEEKREVYEDIFKTIDQEGLAENPNVDHYYNRDTFKFSCPCGKVIGCGKNHNKAKVTAHLRTAHLPDKKFNCLAPNCSRKYACIATLNLHILSHHPEEREKKRKKEKKNVLDSLAKHAPKFLEALTESDRKALSK